MQRVFKITLYNAVIFFPESELTIEVCIGMGKFLLGRSDSLTI